MYVFNREEIDEKKKIKTSANSDTFTMGYSFDISETSKMLSPHIILEDDEESYWELSDDANEKIKRGLEDIKQGRTTSFEDVKKEFED